jgi:hypothetical protein
MTELRFDVGEIRPEGRHAWTRRLRRPLLVVAVTVLCGAFYLAGIWSGMHGRMTCTMSSPTEMVCGTSAGTTPPEQPTVPSQETASA